MLVMMVRVALFSAAFLVMGAAPTLAATYCEGWREGYVVAYQAKAGGFRPLVPLCPLSPLRNLGEPQDDGQRGHFHGVLAGTAAAAK